jgi:alpha-beta hydrolase superfamily lysophospholipase
MAVTMNIFRKPVRLKSLGDELSGVLFTVPGEEPAPVLIICHGAGEFKENYFELCEQLALRGVATLALDMHGHGESGGERYHVEIQQWVADIRAAVDFLLQHPGIDGKRVGAFGLSSGGTAVLEAALVEPRLKTLITLDATVRNSLSLAMTCFLKSFVLLGKMKKRFTRQDLRIPLASLGKFNLASDPEVNRKLQADPRAKEAFMAFPFPGGSQAFFVDTLKRVSGIKAPTLILWGEDDKLDPPETARLLYDALSCEKQLHVIPGNGHVGHLDRNRFLVFTLTADWALQKLGELMVS